MPDLLRYQLADGPHAGKPASERGEIERLARECETAECDVGLDSTVVETRFNVVRSGVPAVVATVRKLRDYLPPEDRAGSPVWAPGRGLSSPLGVLHGRRTRRDDASPSTRRAWQLAGVTTTLFALGTLGHRRP